LYCELFAAKKVKKKTFKATPVYSNHRLIFFASLEFDYFRVQLKFAFTIRHRFSSEMGT